MVAVVRYLCHVGGADSEEEHVVVDVMPLCLDFVQVSKHNSGQGGQQLVSAVKSVTGLPRPAVKSDGLAWMGLGVCSVWEDCCLVLLGWLLGPFGIVRHSKALLLAPLARSNTILRNGRCLVFSLPIANGW